MYFFIAGTVTPLTFLLSDKSVMALAIICAKGSTFTGWTTRSRCFAWLVSVLFWICADLLRGSCSTVFPSCWSSELITRFNIKTKIIVCNSDIFYASGRNPFSNDRGLKTLGVKKYVTDKKLRLRNRRKQVYISHCEIESELNLTFWKALLFLLLESKLQPELERQAANTVHRKFQSSSIPSRRMHCF